MRCLALALLLALVACSSGDGDAPSAVFDEPDLPTPIHSPILTREQAIVSVWSLPILPANADIRAISIDATTVEAAESALIEGQTSTDRTLTAWSVRVRYIGDQGIQFSHGPTQLSPIIGCYQAAAYFTDVDFGVATTHGDGPRPSSDCDFAPTADLAVLRAALELSAKVSPLTSSDITVVETTWADAVIRLRDATAYNLFAGGIDDDEPVWYIEFVGPAREVTPIDENAPPSSSPPPTPLIPTPGPPCRITVAIVHQREVMFADSVERDACD